MMKKKIFFIFIALFIIVSIIIIYLNQGYLPTKIKSLIVSSLQEATQKKVNLESLQFHIFKGLVLKNLTIYDDQTTIVSIKESALTFLILPIFKKKLIIPTLRLKSPVVFLERKIDSTFNIQDLFPKKAPRIPKVKFSIFIYKVSVTDASIHFQDDTLSPVFTKNIEKLDLVLNLALPASVKFRLKSEIPAATAINITATGEYKIPDKQLVSQISIKNFSPQDFQGYYRDFGVSITEGTIEAVIDLNLKNNLIDAKISSQNKNLAISKDKISLKLNAQINADLKYNLINKQLEYSGIATIAKSDIAGLDFLERLTDINGQVEFNNSGVFSDKLSANIWAIPIEAKLRLADFKKPLLNIDITSSLDLNSIQGLLKDKFKFSFPADIQGRGNLLLKIEARLPLVRLPQINGSLDILNARLNLEKLKSSIEDISGRIEFDLSRLSWSEINFKYSGLPYKTTGALTNFKSPSVQLELSSRDLSLESTFAINQKLIKLSKLQGQYLNSKFSVRGDIDTTEPSSLVADLSGQLNINLADIKEPFKKFKDQLERIKPEGTMDAQFRLRGNINDLKSCTVEAGFSSSSLSAYGLKAQKFFLNYSQADGLVAISPLHLSLYDGTIEANAKMNLNSENLPFWISADIQGVKLEKLKLDTAAGEKDIAGAITAQVKLNGFSNDLSKLSGAGQINITEGKLWQLDLFKGLGALLFAKDFSQIIFREGLCGFSIQDKYIFTDNLKLKSNITDLTGSVKIGFDSSIDASLNVQILNEMVPLSGTFKDITTAILGQTGRFGVIKISGTLKEPKYKFQPAVKDIIKGIKNILFGNPKE